MLAAVRAVTGCGAVHASEISTVGAVGHAGSRAANESPDAASTTGVASDGTVVIGPARDVGLLTGLRVRTRDAERPRQGPENGGLLTRLHTEALDAAVESVGARQGTRRAILNAGAGNRARRPDATTGALGRALGRTKRFDGASPRHRIRSRKISKIRPSIWPPASTQSAKPAAPREIRLAPTQRPFCSWSSEGMMLACGRF